MKQSISAIMTIALVFSPSLSAQAVSNCKTATQEYSQQIKIYNVGPGTLEKKNFLRDCVEPKKKGVLTCAQQWKIEMINRQQNAIKTAQQIVLNNKKCFSPTLVAQIEVNGK